MSSRLISASLVAALGAGLTIAIGSPALGQSTTQQPTTAQTGQPTLVYSPWTKFCVKSDEKKNAKQVCMTASDARLESGTSVVAAMLIEPRSGSRKVLRVTLPLGMQLAPGTRLVVDQGKPALGAYVICFSNGCVADYDATADVINRLKKGRQLAVQAINADGEALSLNLPLGDFAKAYDGPPSDMTGYEEQQQKRREELQALLNEIHEKASQKPARGAKPQ